MILKKTVFILFILFFYLPGSSQEVKIKGTAPYYTLHEISAWNTNDYISNTQSQLAYTAIDSSGNFLLEFSVKEIQYITLKIDQYITSLFVEPDKTYDVIVHPPDSTAYSNPNLEQTVDLSVKLTSKIEMNALAIDFDQRFDDFLSFYYPLFVSRSAKTAIDSFNLMINEYYKDVHNPYFNSYVNYAIASLKEKTKESTKKLFTTYLEGKPIQYNNPEYMNFFNSFYKQRLQIDALSKSGNVLFFQINDRGSFKGASNLLAIDPFLKNDTIRELVLLKGLYESYYDGTFKKSSIIPMLQQAAEESKIVEHREIALNILHSFSKLKKGTPAPAFNLPDKTGKTVSLDELRATNKYIYLTFFDQNCSECIQQMKVIPSLKKAYGERIAFVSITTDKSNASLKNFCAANPQYDWTFLYDNSNGQLKKDYEVITLPGYFLINPEGNFVQVPAESPASTIEQVFYTIVKPKTKRQQVGSKKNF